MWHHVCLICTEEDTTGVVLEHFANFTVKTTIKQKPTIIELIIHNARQTLNYATSFVLGLSGSSQTPVVTHLSFSSHLINTRKLLFTWPSYFVKLHQEPREELIYQVDKTNTCY